MDDRRGHNGISVDLAANFCGPVSFRLSRGSFRTIRASNLDDIRNPASIEQIGEMDHERALLPLNLNKWRLRVLLDFDAGTTGKCGRARSTAWDSDDRASEGVRAAHRVMREHASRHKRSRRG